MAQLTVNTTSTKPHNILLLSLSGIGNFIMQSPVFELLKRHHPSTHITVWVAPRGTKTLAEINPHIDDVIEAPIQQSGLQHLRFAYNLTQQHFTTGVVLSPGQLLKSAAYLFLAGIPQRIGHRYPLWKNPRSGLLLTDPILEKENLHDVEQNLRLLEPLGISLGSAPHYYKLELPANVRERAVAHVHSLGISENEQLFGIHPGSAASMSWKRWPVEHFTEVARGVKEKKNMRVLIFGGPDEQEVAHTLQKHVGGNSVVVEADLLTTAATIGRCKQFLTNDSGLMHIAAALNVPTFALFGPTDERLTGPYSPRSTIIRAPGTSPVYTTEHNPDLGSQPYASMRKITSDRVLEKLL